MGIVNSVELISTLFTSLECSFIGKIEERIDPTGMLTNRRKEGTEQEWLLQVGLVNELVSLETQKTHLVY